MTIEKLKQYNQIKGEIEDIEAELNELKKYKTMDVVKASYDGFPYTEYSSKVYGYDPTVDKKRVTLYDKKLCKKAELEQLRKEIESFIDGISNSRIRRIIKFKYIKGLSWVQTAHRTGYNSDDACRMALKNYLKKI